MRAMVLEGVGQALRVEDRPELVPGAGEVVVALRAAALNRRDYWIQRGQYAGLKFPIVLGSDGVGTVAGVGEGVDATLVGREVIILPSLAWGSDPRFADPASFRILGLPDDGTFADQVRVPAANLYPRPPHLSWEEAAAVPLAALTAYRALVTRGGLRAGERVLVTGLGGGAAAFAAQFAHALGAEVWATSSRPEVRARAAELGVAETVDYRVEGWQERLRDSGGFDLVIDSAGGPGFSRLLEAVRPGGRVVFFGATTGNPPGIDLRRIFWRQISLLGTTMGSPADFAAMLDLLASHRVRPWVDSVRPLEEAQSALDAMGEGRQIGKLVLFHG